MTDREPSEAAMKAAANLMGPVTSFAFVRQLATLLDTFAADARRQAPDDAAHPSPEPGEVP